MTFVIDMTRGSGLLPSIMRPDVKESLRRDIESVPRSMPYLLNEGDRRVVRSALAAAIVDIPDGDLKEHFRGVYERLCRHDRIEPVNLR